MAKILTSPVNSKFYSALDSSSINPDKSLSTFEHELSGRQTNGTPDASAAAGGTAASENIIDIEGSTTRPIVDIPILKPAPMYNSRDSGEGGVAGQSDGNMFNVQPSDQFNTINNNNNVNVITSLNKTLPPLYPDLGVSTWNKNSVVTGKSGVITIDDDDDIVVTQVIKGPKASAPSKSPHILSLAAKLKEIVSPNSQGKPANLSNIQQALSAILTARQEEKLSAPPLVQQSIPPNPQLAPRPSFFKTPESRTPSTPLPPTPTVPNHSQQLQNLIHLLVAQKNQKLQQQKQQQQQQHPPPHQRIPHLQSVAIPSESVIQKHPQNHHPNSNTSLIQKLIQMAASKQQQQQQHLVSQQQQQQHQPQIINLTGARRQEEPKPGAISSLQSMLHNRQQQQQQQSDNLINLQQTIKLLQDQLKAKQQQSPDLNNIIHNIIKLKHSPQPGPSHAGGQKLKSPSLLNQIKQAQQSQNRNKQVARQRPHPSFFKQYKRNVPFVDLTMDVPVVHHSKEKLKLLGVVGLVTRQEHHRIILSQNLRKQRIEEARFRLEVETSKKSRKRKKRGASDMDDSDGDTHENYCSKCRMAGELLMCDRCPKVFHLFCLDPPLRQVPDGEWYCSQCQEEKDVEESMDVNVTDIIDDPAVDKESRSEIEELHKQLLQIKRARVNLEASKDNT